MSKNRRQQDDDAQERGVPPVTYTEASAATDLMDYSPVLDRLQSAEHVMILFEVMQDVIASSRRLQEMKKALFYGTPLSSELKTWALMRNYSSPNVVSKAELVQRTRSVRMVTEHVQRLHAIIGAAGETGEELMRLVYDAMFYGKQPPADKLVDEAGDVEWYLALLYRTLGVTQAQVQVANRDKLRTRFPARFSESAAINKDSELEAGVVRKSLETGREAGRGDK